MKYWSEKCPYCGAKTFRSDLDSEKTFDTPLVVCRSCGQTYIHPDRIELGVLTKEGLSSFKGAMTFSLIWRLALFGIVVFVICVLVQVKLFPSFENVERNSAIVALLFFGFSSFMRIRCLNKMFDEELKKSKSRLQDESYRSLLKRSGYHPKW